MKRFTACAAAAMVLAMPGTARAAWIHDAAGNTIQPYAGWAATFDVPAPNADVTVLGTPEGFCDPAPSCATQTGVHTATIYLGRGGRDRQAFAHELGHVFDYTMMTDADRHTFLVLIGTPSRPWRATNGDSPHEQFAEAYRVCATFGSSYSPARALASPFGLGYGYDPSVKTERRICRLVYRVGTGS